MPNGHPQKKIEGHVDGPVLIDASVARFSLLEQLVNLFAGIHGPNSRLKLKKQSPDDRPQP